MINFLRFKKEEEKNNESIRRNAGFASVFYFRDP